MDPNEVIGLCERAAQEGAPADLIVPSVFTVGEYEATWKRDPAAVRRALDGVLCGPFPADGLELLMKSGALHALFPELVAVKDLGDAFGMHKDVWAHTKAVVAGVPAQLELRWGALMHDIGKAPTRRIRNGRVTFHGHDVVGAKMLDKLEQRLDLFVNDSTLFTTVRSLVLHHLRPAAYKRTWTDSGVRRLLNDLGSLRNFERLMALSRADLTTKVPAKRMRAMDRANELEDRVKLVYSADNAPKLPKGTMGVIMEKVATKPGPWLNTLRDELETLMQAGILEADRDVDYYVRAGLSLVEQHSQPVQDDCDA